MNKRIWTGICLLMLVLSGCGEASAAYFDKAEQELSQESEETEILDNVQETKEEEDTECYVHVCGAVVQPGVYKLPANSRIYEAIFMAGGLSEDACEESINQAGEVTDGQMLKVLTIEEAKTLEAGQLRAESAEDADSASGLVNINTADAAGLMTLPGIGAAKAESILSYREENGSFASIEDIKNITGIKEGVYSKIKDYITVN